MKTTTMTLPADNTVASLEDGQLTLRQESGKFTALCQLGATETRMFSTHLYRYAHLTPVDRHRDDQTLLVVSGSALSCLQRAFFFPDGTVELVHLTWTLAGDHVQIEQQLIHLSPASVALLLPLAAASRETNELPMAVNSLSAAALADLAHDPGSVTLHVVVQFGQSATLSTARYAVVADGAATGDGGGVTFRRHSTDSSPTMLAEVASPFWHEVGLAVYRAVQRLRASAT